MSEVRTIRSTGHCVIEIHEICTVVDNVKSYTKNRVVRFPKLISEAREAMRILNQNHTLRHENPEINELYLLVENYKTQAERMIALEEDLDYWLEEIQEFLDEHKHLMDK